MLRAHSLLWHYLWIAPNIVLLLVALLMWRRGLQKRFPAFVAFAVLAAAGQLILYAVDVMPWTSGPEFWGTLWATLFVESILKCFLLGEIFAHLLDSYSAISKLGKTLIRGVGVGLLLVASLVGVFARSDTPYRLIFGAHILEQTSFFIQCGLVLFLFLFAWYFNLLWENRDFGILLGLGISASIHLIDWAITTSGALPDKRHLLDFMNMATFHGAVLVWAYFVFVPQERAVTTVVKLPDHNLEVWNRELERLLHK